MKIILNNREDILETNSLTVQQLIELKNFSFRLLVTKVNGKLVKREDRNTSVIQDGDNVAILHMISGG